MTQGARRSAMSSSQIRQVAKQAQVWADWLVELHERIRPRFGASSRARAGGRPASLAPCPAK
jgi:hypothetical protein